MSAVLSLLLLVALGPPADGGSPAVRPTSVVGRDAAPQPGAPARGSLAKEDIRRVVRSHIDEVKACYQQELTKEPSLSPPGRRQSAGSRRGTPR